MSDEDYGAHLEQVVGEHKVQTPLVDQRLDGRLAKGDLLRRAEYLEQAAEACRLAARQIGPEVVTVEQALRLGAL